eukprot:gene9617-1839_t
MTSDIDLDRAILTTSNCQCHPPISLPSSFWSVSFYLAKSSKVAFYSRLQTNRLIIRATCRAQLTAPLLFLTRLDCTALHWTRFDWAALGCIGLENTFGFPTRRIDRRQDEHHIELCFARS